MSAQKVGDIESRLIDILERCHAAVRDPSISTGDAFAPHLRGALGQFPTYSPEEIVDTEGSLSMSILIGANSAEMQHADPHMASH